MSNPEADNLFTTHAAIMLHQWPVVVKIITDITRSAKAQAEQKPPATSPISQEEFLQALSSPFRNWLLEILSSYGLLMDWSLQLSIHSDKTIKESLQKYGQSSATKPQRPLSKDQLKKLSKVKLEALQNDLDQLTNEQYAQWQQRYQQWMQQLEDNLSKAGLSLNSDEKASLERFDLSHELVNFANELQLDLEKKLYNPNTFALYLQLKVILTIYNCLSRQQQATDMKTINQYMKKLKILFNIISKQETECIKLEKLKLEDLTSPPS